VPLYQQSIDKAKVFIVLQGTSLTHNTPWRHKNTLAYVLIYAGAIGYSNNCLLQIMLEIVN